MRDEKSVYLSTAVLPQAKVRKTIGEIKPCLENNEFVTVDRGGMVNLLHVSNLTDSTILFGDGEKLGVSRSNIKSVKNLIAVYWGDKI